MKPAAPVTRMGVVVHSRHNSILLRFRRAVEHRAHVEDRAVAVAKERGYERPAALDIFIMRDGEDDRISGLERLACDERDAVFVLGFVR